MATEKEIIKEVTKAIDENKVLDNSISVPRSAFRSFKTFDKFLKSH